MAKTSQLCTKGLQKTEGKEMKARKTPKAPAYPYRDLYSRVLEARLGNRWWAEWPFHPTRKWRFDYACPDLKIAIEIDGGVWNNVRGEHAGRHSGGTGQLKDFEKMNAAAELGWVVLHYVPSDKMDTRTLLQIHNVMKTRTKELK